MFDKILNWKLLKGSHTFPGPDGGTCINEAAIFEYRQIHRAEDCPPCFSRPIAGYAIRLNDDMPDEMRQALLMPFVTKLAGTADTEEVEASRYRFIFVETFKRLVLPDEEDNKHNCYYNPYREREIYHYARLRESISGVGDVMRALDRMIYREHSRMLHLAAHAFRDACQAPEWRGVAPLAAVAQIVDRERRYVGGSNPYMTATRILAETIEIGTHQEIDVRKAAPRLEKAKTCRPHYAPPAGYIPEKEKAYVLA